jgi:hypothetical protein
MFRAMRAAPIEVAVRGIERPPIRLRTVLLLVVVGISLLWLRPRAVAAWHLYGRATAVADYGACTVGPTGPTLLRDNAQGYQELLRRRLVSAAPDEKPFAGCAKLARQITGSADAERAHLAAASAFIEYEGGSADTAATGRVRGLTLGDLGVTTRPLADLAARSWPFVREGYTRLVKPSASAREAVHPIGTARPAVGRGLPGYRALHHAARREGDRLVLWYGSGVHLAAFESANGGVSWKPASPKRRGMDSTSERCASLDSTSSYRMTSHGDVLHVASLEDNRAVRETELRLSGHEVFAAACDKKALVLALRADGAASVALARCLFAAPCAPMPLPRTASAGSVPRYPLDIARVDGTTVLAVETHGIVRVSSTRDDGGTWTPFSVAYDDAAHPDLRVNHRVPKRLLTLGRRVFLYAGGARSTQTYSLLVSDDGGASWRAP